MCDLPEAIQHTKAMAARAEAEAARRWARYGEDVGPDEDVMPDADEEGADEDDVRPAACLFELPSLQDRSTVCCSSKVMPFV